MGNYKDHRMQRYERSQVINKEYENGNRLTIDQLEKEIGDKALAFKVLNMSKIDGIDIQTLLSRISVIKSIFTDNGSTVEESIKFIKSNKTILYLKSSDVLRSAEIICTIFEEAKKNRKEFIDFISSQSGNRSVLLNNSTSMKKTTNLIIKIFNSKGYSLEKAYNFVINHINLLSMEYVKLINILSLLHMVSLEDKLLFEDNNNIDFDYNTEYLYDSIKEFILNKEAATLDRLKERIKEKSRLGLVPEHTLSSNLMFCIRAKYELSLNPKKEENLERTL